MQCKHIPNKPILEHIATHGGIGCTWYKLDDGPMSVAHRSVIHAMPKGIDAKLVLAKMRQLIKGKLVDGCGCGCRGDFELTDKGRLCIKEQDNG